MNGRDPNSEAYQILADLMVTIRRIIHRGMVKVSGDTWYLDGCPEGLFEKLVQRKEDEKAIDRFGGEYQELITFASLDDLAAMIEYNTDLRKLLASLESDDSSIIERLRDIEALRLKMAASVPFEDGDIETLNRYHQEFRDSLTRKKPAPGDEPSTNEATEDAPEEAADDADDDWKEASTADSEDEEPEPEPEDNDHEPDPVTPGEEGMEELFNGDDDMPADPAETSGEFGTQAATFEELVEVVGGPAPDRGAEPEHDDAAARADDEPGGGTRPIPTLSNGSNAQVIEAELAMAEDDNAKVLKALHGEVTAVAEGAFRNMLDIETPVWDTIRSSGWYDMKKAELALAPLELFYTVVERAAEIQKSGAGLESVKACLEEAEFSKLLLSLREVFMRHSH